MAALDRVPAALARAVRRLGAARARAAGVGRASRRPRARRDRRAARSGRRVPERDGPPLRAEPDDRRVARAVRPHADRGVRVRRAGRRVRQRRDSLGRRRRRRDRRRTRRRRRGRARSPRLVDEPGAPPRAGRARSRTGFLGRSAWPVVARQHLDFFEELVARRGGRPVGGRCDGARCASPCARTSPRSAGRAWTAWRRCSSTSSGAITPGTIDAVAGVPAVPAPRHARLVGAARVHVRPVA